MRWSCVPCALLIACSAVQAEDWPQWLGPRRDGSTLERVVPWKGKLEILWRAPAGEGNGSPIVAAGRVFLHAKIANNNQEEVIAFDAGTGRQIWRQQYDRAAFTSLFGNGPRASPATTSRHVYTYGITGILTCWDVETGAKVWQVDALRQFQAANLFFGAACSPLIVDGRIIVNVGAKGASIVAFDCLTGAVLWKALDDKASYSSPILIEQGGQQLVVVLTAAGLTALRPADGQAIWHFPMVDKLFESSATPIRCGDLLLASSITYGAVGLRLTTRNGKPAVEQAWKQDTLTSYFSTPVPIGPEQIYFVSGTKPPALTNKALLHCIDARTGAELWPKPRQVGTYHASLIRTQDDKVLTLEEPGDLVLLQPDAVAYRELARAKVSGNTWAHPAVANGKIYIRDNKELLCVKLPVASE